jgi:hypothetical protein
VEACKDASQEECERVWGWRLTFPSELLFWELESRWTSEPSESDCRGQNTSHWEALYIDGKLLKCRCLKWACMTHSDICNTSYGKKKGWATTKCWERDSHACRWCATHCWKALDEIYNFASHLVPIGGLSTKFKPRKVTGVPTLAVSGLPFGTPRTKSHLDVAFANRCRVYYMGEGGGFPRAWAVVSLVSPKSPVTCPSTKGAPT